MAENGSVAWSSVGKKVITGVTGFALMGFIIAHLIGNLTLFIGPAQFNGYAHFLESILYGWFVIAFELVMLFVFLFHMIAAITVAWTDRRKARTEGYRYARNAGGKSRKTLSSTTMIYTGILIILFVIGHIYLFKINPSHENLYATVSAAFSGIGFTAFTMIIMILLGFHLCHGFWSAFQSLGWTNDKYLPVLTRIALAFAVIMAIGFFVIPVYMYFSGDSSFTMPGGH